MDRSPMNALPLPVVWSLWARQHVASSSPLGRSVTSGNRCSGRSLRDLMMVGPRIFRECYNNSSQAAGDLLP